MFGKWSLVIVLIMTSLTIVWAQDDTITTSISVLPSYAETDTAIWVQDEPEPAFATPFFLETDTVLTVKKSPPVKQQKSFSPNARLSVLFGLIPGGGQIYNRKYWKLPIVYGGFMGCIYALTWNGNYYSEYRNGYRDIIFYTEIENGYTAWKQGLPPNSLTVADESWKDKYGSWMRFIPPGYDENTVDKNWLRSTLQRKTDYYRRNRDLSVIVTVAVYALTMIDAFVDAKLYDFDISPDLSLRLEPYFAPTTNFKTSTLGISCRLNFKK